MAKLSQEMKDLVAAQQCFVATVNPDGSPDVGPKRSTRVLDDEHIMFAEVTGNQTWRNVQRGSRVAIAVVDREKMRGFRFVGNPEVITSGEVFDATVAALRARGMMAPLKGVVKVRIDRIYNLGIPGAGELVA
jgi:predicted pyridoxine 5'-phosphate oxidase superfamily flavin-nucleotide-binding protein